MKDEMKDLHKYGITEEQSDIRAHVCFPGKQVIVFRTQDMVSLLRKKGSMYPQRPAYQPNVSGATAMGYCVPITDISPCFNLQSEHYDWDRHNYESMNLAQKGDAAVDVVLAAIKANKFPLWVCGIVTCDKELDISGTDITIRASRRIQVKCDEKAWSGGTGNLYIQTHERNPLKIHGQKCINQNTR